MAAVSGYGTQARSTAELAREIERISLPLEDPTHLDPLMERIGDARYVLLGEASHGTREYYTWRAEISKRLIAERGFSFIAVEGDWPDCYRVNRFVKGDPDLGGSAHAVLRAFDRWPTWMWANEEVADLAGWMRWHNESRSEGEKVGFYGLDVYSLWDSLYTVINYLQQAAPDAVDAAIGTFRCFQPFGHDPQEYAWATLMVPHSCEDAVVKMLTELCEKAAALRSSSADGEAFFNAEQNALVVQNAEHYYRTMVRGDASSWNVRDCHMMDTLERLMAHHGPQAKAIVWEHNTHIGDARATDMARSGMVNVGQLARERHAREGVVLVGFGSYEGSVIAGRKWGAPMEMMPVPPAQSGSYEEAFHRAGARNHLVILDDAPDGLRQTRGHRAIGVVYNPENERFGNYVPTVMADRYDVFLYVDRTRALRPLHLRVRPDTEVPETFPSGV